MALEIEEWEIWHTYTTFLEPTSIDLQESAHRLVASRIAECAMLRNGRTFWRSEDNVGSGSTTIDVNSAGRPSTFALTLDEGCTAKPHGFALEVWGQASQFLIAERSVLGDHEALPAPYLRAFLGKCVLTSKLEDGTHSDLHLYPVLTVYESGVLMVEFRMIGPNTTTSLTNFIAGGVNLFRFKFDNVEVTPGLSAFATRAYYQSAEKLSFIRRVQVAWHQAGHDIAVRRSTRKQTDKDFSFDLAPLSNSEGNDLKDVALTMFHTAVFIISSPKVGLAFILWGQNPAPLVGEFWSGRPHIHLVSFRGQRKTASENESHHGADFGRILSRVSILDEDEARKMLPTDGRLFQDYSAYVTSAASLWVWSKDGLATQRAVPDLNRANLIYGRQVLAELLEYGYMLHRGLYHRVESFSTTAEVISTRKDVLRLRLKMREASHSGEIRNLLESGWSELGLPDLISEIDAALDLRAAETSSIEAQRATLVGWALTIVFGFVAVPALADQVVKPLWELTRFHHFSNASVTTAVSDLIAVFVVLIVLGAALILIPLRRRR